jgi:hypothetical protein
MRLTPILSLAALTALSTAAPSTQSHLITRHAELADLTKSKSETRDTCPTGYETCGVVTWKLGTFTSFGEGVCIQLAGDIDNIYVGHCYCSLWETCTGHTAQDSFVGVMSMCEKPKKPEEFGDKAVKFISCGGMN